MMLPLLLVQGNHDFYTEANRSGVGAQPVSTGLLHGGVMVNPSLLSYQGVELRLPTYYATSLAGVRWIVLDTNLRSAVQLQVICTFCPFQKLSDACCSGCVTSFEVRLPLRPIFVWSACTYPHGSNFGNGNRGETATPTARATRRILCTCAHTYCPFCSEEAST